MGNRRGSSISFVRLLKFVSIILLGITIALNLPILSQLASHFNPFSYAKSISSYAQSEQSGNLLQVDETLTTFDVVHHGEYGHWIHTLHNVGHLLVEGPEADIFNFTYIVKLPESLSHLLDHPYVIDYLFNREHHFDYVQRSFTVTGTAVNEDGTEILINHSEHRPYHYLNINYETNSLEFALGQFFKDNNLKPHIVLNESGEHVINTLTFQIPFVIPEEEALDNGSYEFKTAVVKGQGIDLDTIEQAHRENLVIIYQKEEELDQPSKEDILKSLIEEAEQIKRSDYTESSYEKLEASLINAKEIMMNETVKEETIEESISSLEQALASLEKVKANSEEVNALDDVEQEELELLEQLEALVTEAKNYDASDYTEVSFESFLEAVNVAEGVLVDTTVTEETILETLETLKGAMNDLEKLDDKENVETTESEDPENEIQTDESSQTEEVTVDESNDPNDHPDDINETEETELNEVVDKEKLSKLVTKAKKYEATDYTQSSYQALQTVLEVAEAILQDEQVTVEEVNDAVDALQKAIEDLEKIESDEINEPSEADSKEEPNENEATEEETDANEKEVDPKEETYLDQLSKLIKQAKQYRKDDYTEDSFTALLDVLVIAEKVLDNDERTEEDVIKAIDTLQSAIDGLKAEESTPAENKVHKKQSSTEENNDKKQELSALIEHAQSLQVEDYTHSSFEVLKEALDFAEEVFANESSSREDIDKAIATLEKAIQQLNKTQSNNENPKENSSKNNSVKEKEQEGEQLPDTATNHISLMMVGGLLVVIGMMLFILRRRIA